MKTKIYLLITFFSFLTKLTTLQAQTYCAPTFANGCATWSNQTINVGTINWTLSDCYNSEDTAMSATFIQGTPEAMTVVSGTWTGCAVYADLNNDGDFADSENLYYSYVGGDPSYTYSFNITVPLGTPDGSYRMRVIAPWGSDGFTVGPNGNGGCGTYQYGNFNDFTMLVGTTVGNNTLEMNKNKLTIAPNPASDNTSILFEKAFTGTVTISDIAGRIVKQLTVNNQKQIIVETDGLSNGLYQVNTIGNINYAAKLELMH